MISKKLDKLENITKRQQELGTENLEEFDIKYNDGTIQGVMEHISAIKKGSGAIFTVVLVAGMTVISETIITDERVVI